jgi:hypothetical protein
MSNTPLSLPDLRDTFADTWVATDGLGRTLPGFAECGPPRANRFVGMFYFVWLGWHDQELYDITKLLAANPDDPQYGPVGQFHWWGEPHLGYYRSEDRFVIRKHAELLTNAGVDVIILDVTNGFTYDPTVLAICEEYRALRALGQPTPQIAFLTNSGSANVVRHLYENFYAKGLYPELWFDWKGKPLLLSSQEGIEDAAILDFFSWRRSWAWTKDQEWFGDGHGRWPWLDQHPQNFGWHEDPARPEQMSVCVAQHPISDIGRSFHAGAEPPPEAERPLDGLCFQEQWDRALEVDPEFVLVTGWNEWVAQRFLKQPNNDPPQAMVRKALAPGDSFFVDQYNLEFSRDIEPMRGGYGDAYYYQLVANIRRFKGVRPPHPASLPQTIPVDSDDFRDWARVQPEFRDNVGDIAHRDHAGWGGLRYRNTSGRNDFETLKVARDNASVFFYVRTREPIRLPENETGMCLLIDSDGNPATGWEGFNLAVKIGARGGLVFRYRQITARQSAWEYVAGCAVMRRDNELHFGIPRPLISSAESSQAIRFDFQWIDNIEPFGDCDIADFLDQGDTAPSGRFRYRYHGDANRAAWRGDAS